VFAILKKRILRKVQAEVEEKTVAPEWLHFVLSEVRPEEKKNRWHNAYDAACNTK
jgi:hypothetical protein